MWFNFSPNDQKNFIFDYFLFKILSLLAYVVVCTWLLVNGLLWLTDCFDFSNGIFTLHGNGTGNNTWTKLKVQYHVEMLTVVQDKDRDWDLLFLNRAFYKLDEIGNNANISIWDFTTWKQKIPVTKCCPQWVWNPGL